MSCKYIQILIQRPAQHYWLYVLHNSSISAEINAIVCFILVFIIGSLVSNTSSQWKNNVSFGSSFSKDIPHYALYDGAPIMVSMYVLYVSAARQCQGEWSPSLISFACTEKLNTFLSIYTYIYQIICHATWKKGVWKRTMNSLTSSCWSIWCCRIWMRALTR